MHSNCDRMDFTDEEKRSFINLIDSSYDMLSTDLKAEYNRCKPLMGDEIIGTMMYKMTKSLIMGASPEMDERIRGIEVDGKGPQCVAEEILSIVADAVVMVLCYRCPDTQGKSGVLIGYMQFNGSSRIVHIDKDGTVDDRKADDSILCEEAARLAHDKTMEGWVQSTLEDAAEMCSVDMNQAVLFTAEEIEHYLRAKIQPN